MRRLLHLLVVSSMISGLLFFGATSAFASQLPELPGVPGLPGGEDDPTGGLLGEGGLEGLLCSLLGPGGTLDLGLELLQCTEPVTTPPTTTPPPAAPISTGSTGDVGGGQVSSVPSGGVSTGGATTPVATTALIGALLAMAAIGAGLGRALARS
ncbi:MAG: hypothetical protein ABR592_11330 [Nitriliruptorales bacterium]